MSETTLFPLDDGDRTACTDDVLDRPEREGGVVRALGVVDAAVSRSGTRVMG